MEKTGVHYTFAIRKTGGTLRIQILNWRAPPLFYCKFSGGGGRPACMCLFFYRLRFLYIILYQRIDKPSMYKKRNTGRTPAGNFSDDQHPHDHFTVFLLPWHSITTQQERPAAAGPKFYQAQDAPIMINKMNNTTSKAKPPP